VSKVHHKRRSEIAHALTPTRLCPRSAEVGAFRDVPAYNMKSSKVGEERKYWEEARRTACFRHFALSIFGLGLSIAENETTWQGMQHGLSFNMVSEVLKGASVITTFISYYFLFHYYESMINMRRLVGVILPPGVTVSSLRGAGLWHQCILDILLLLPQPIPMFDTEVMLWNKGLGRYSVYDLDSVMTCLMMVRLFHLARFYGECVSTLTSSSVLAFGNLNRVNMDADFVLRFVLANNLAIVFVIAVIQVAVFSYLMMVFERPTDEGTLQSFSNCVWLIIITMTTVGYGDEYPTTMLGRVASIMASITAVIMLAVTINLVISKVSMNRNEEKLVCVIERINDRKEIRQKSVTVIQRWIRAIHEYVAETKSGKDHKALDGYKIERNTEGELRSAVLSNTSLLVAINDFKRLAESSFVSNMDNDMPSLVGQLSSRLELQTDVLTDMALKTLTLHDLVERIKEKKASS
jgi:hypothetical protein